VNKTVVPKAVRPLMISYIARRPRGSSPEVGSSGKSTGGDIIKQALKGRQCWHEKLLISFQSASHRVLLD